MASRDTPKLLHVKKIGVPTHAPAASHARQGPHRVPAAVMHWSVGSSQPWHASCPAQGSPEWTQVPPLHVSVPLQKSPSSQGWPSLGPATTQLPPPSQA